MIDKNSIRLTIIGLGYVGLPLAVEFGKKYETIGFDTNQGRILDLKRGIDRTKELTAEQLKQAGSLSFTQSLDPVLTGDPVKKNIYIITVPTPVDAFKKPDLGPLISASMSVGKVLKKEDVVIYESTVYPGCTEEDCVPVLERYSGLKYNEDFFCGYSPERINPGDKSRTITKIRKVTSGSTPLTADFVDELYQSVIEAGTMKASSLKVAEAAKIIENCQRDINIAFVNELAFILNKMEIDTAEVLEVARSKWNFLDFRPGLVGGHCIGVDPYYLTHKAESLGYHPQVILAGRRINDSIGKYVASETIKLLIKSNHSINDSKILILGVTFKENCTDIRNSRVIDIIDELRDYNINFDVFDPWADKEEVFEAYHVNLLDSLNFENYDGVIIAVAHSQFLENNVREQLMSFKGVVYDVKSIYDLGPLSQRL